MSQQKRFEHANANAVGVADERFDKANPIVHFRGIKYASIPERFAAPVPAIRDKQGKLEATDFGPRCPQVPVDVRDLMQIPKHLEQHAPDLEDELECLNLNIAMPANAAGPLPVLIWIYGGAQMVSFSTAAQRLCDPGFLVAQSIAQGQPCIIVTLNYRLNLLAYGDALPNRTPNLQLRDLEVGIEWVHDNIASFSGSPADITLAGESAGAILTHALLNTLPRHITISRALLCSGSLLASPPTPSSAFLPTLRKIESRIRDLAASQNHPSASNLTLATTPLPLLISAIAIHPLSTIPIQTEPLLPTFPAAPLSSTITRPGIKSIMLGDCEFEGILWLAAIRLVSASAITSAFHGSQTTTNSPFSTSGTNPTPTQRLTAAYLSHPTLPAATSLGLSQPQTAALQFMADHHFNWANWTLAKSLHTSSSSSTTTASPLTSTNTPTNTPKIYQYLFDQPNPFALTLPPLQGVPRAHHAVDLLALWGGYDADMPAASPFLSVGRTFRSKILDFITMDRREQEEMEHPWAPGNVYVFGGPDAEGWCGEIERGEYEGDGGRRRVREAYEVCEEVGWEVREGVWGRLVAVVGQAGMEMVRRALEAQEGRTKGVGEGGAGGEAKL